MASASAPGKVLICGGYLVVEAPNIGLSLGVSARFTTRVTESSDVSGEKCFITVNSPQFRTSFRFVTVTVDGVVSVEQLDGPSSPFLYYGVLYSVACAEMTKPGSSSGKDVTMELLASNDFYSQRNYLEQQGKRVTAATLRTVPEHNPLVGAVSKTGLGSSAAMTTSFVACLMKHFGVAEDTERTHRTAQVAHSVAQGKIGSGFDVFTATYGTSIYRRFPASCAEMMMTGSEPPKSVSVALLHDCIRPDKVWVEPIPFHGLPRGLHLILGDIHQGGSSTPGMVAKVMAWRKSVKDIQDNLWDRLGAANVSYVEVLQRLCAQASEAPEAHDAAVKRLSQIVLSTAQPQSSEETLWLNAFGAASTCRTLLRDAGHEAQVTIEPSELTPLLDATAALPGVLAVGCPGAGGFDAVFALVLGESGCSQVESFWEAYTSGMEVCPLLVREDPRGLSW